MRSDRRGSLHFCGAHISVSFDGGADLLGAGGDGELGFALQASVQSLLGQRGGAAHVLVAGVGAAADQTCGGTKVSPHRPRVAQAQATSSV